MKLNIKKTNNTIKKWSEDANIQFTEGEIQMAKEYLKICSILLVSGEMKIKIMTRHFLTLVRIAIVKKSTNNKYCRECGKKDTLLHYWWECKLLHLLWRTVWRFLKNLNMELPYNPAISLLHIYPEKTTVKKDTCTPVFIVALLTIVRAWKQPKCQLTGEWIKINWYI